MAAIPPPLHATVRRIYALHESRAESEKPRPYLGASSLGEACSRRLWYGFRWAGERAIDGRIRRLFETGHREEERLIAELRAIGITVEGQQHGVEFADGHGKGHLDGAVLGLDEAPRTWHVFECKTHNTRSFKDVVAKGVKVSKPTHYAQVQMYMGLTGMERAAYFAVCKDTDEVHLERIEYDSATFATLTAKAYAIIKAEEPPLRISEDPESFDCRFCPFRDVCHAATIPAMSCRTCAHATPIAAGKWHCAHFDAEIPEEAQRAGCDEHRFIPALLERVAELVEVDGNRLTWRNKLTDRTFTQPGYTSAELVACKDFRIVGDAFMDEVKAVFGDASKVSSPAVGAETWTWQTFHNGTRHIRCERGGQFQTYISQTTESVARMRELGDPTYAPDADFLDNAEVFYDEPKATDGSKATRSLTDGSARRGRKT